jgi:hypothetical protein
VCEVAGFSSLFELYSPPGTTLKDDSPMKKADFLRLLQKSTVKSTVKKFCVSPFQAPHHVNSRTALAQPVKVVTLTATPATPHQRQSPCTASRPCWLPARWCPAHAQRRKVLCLVQPVELAALAALL